MLTAPRRTHEQNTCDGISRTMRSGCHVSCVGRPSTDKICTIATLQLNSTYRLDTHALNSDFLLINPCSDSSNSASRRDSATSGSLSSSVPAQASHSSSSFSLPVTTTHLSPVAHNQYPNPYISDAQSSEDPSRYSTNFVTPSTPSIVVSSDAVSVHTSPFEPIK